MKNFLLLAFVINSLITYAQLTPKSINTGEGVIGFYEFRPSGYNPDSTYYYPLIIFMHGIGERGNGTTELHMALNSSFPKILVKGATMKFVVNGKPHAFLVLIPQMSKNYINWQNFYVDEMIAYAKKNLKIDTNKIFLTGWSLGGGGAWKYATSSIENANKLAGIIPVSPAPDYTDLCNLAVGKVAVWAHHARDDASVPLHYTEDAITGINACLPQIPALITYYPSGGHPYVADWAYDTLNNIEYPNIYQWMIGISRCNTMAINKPPVAKAGNDTVIILPNTSVTLDGKASYDSNGIIVHYEWTVVKGPPSPELNLQKPDFPVTEVTGLEPGSYIFRLTVKDEFGVTRSDDLNVKVILPPNGRNANPIVNAGPDVTIRDNSYYLTGKGRDFDGTITSFHWRQVSGPVSITIVGTGKVANLWGLNQEGIYGLELTAFDNHNPAGIGKDTMFITRNREFPVYFNYFLKYNPNIKNPDIIRYNLLATFLMLSSLQMLICKSFINQKFHSNNLNHVLFMCTFCYFQTFFIFLSSLTHFLCI